MLQRRSTVELHAPTDKALTDLAGQGDAQYAFFDRDSRKLDFADLLPDYNVYQLN